MWLPDSESDIDENALWKLKICLRLVKDLLKVLVILFDFRYCILKGKFE